MSNKRSAIIGCLLLALLTVLTACGPQSTPVPTATPTPLPPTATPTTIPTPTATPEPFAIQDPVFDAEYENHRVDCQNEVDVEVRVADSGDLYFLFGGQMAIPFRGSDFVLWCFGAEHTWIDEATYEGYTFESNPDNPLRFQVNRNAGYLYLSGEGAVTMPDGTEVMLPR